MARSGWQCVAAKAGPGALVRNYGYFTIISSWSRAAVQPPQQNINFLPCDLSKPWEASPCDLSTAGALKARSHPWGHPGLGPQTHVLTQFWCRWPSMHICQSALHRRAVSRDTEVLGPAEHRTPGFQQHPARLRPETEGDSTLPSPTCSPPPLCIPQQGRPLTQHLRGILAPQKALGCCCPNSSSQDQVTLAQDQVQTSQAGPRTTHRLLLDR